MPYTHRPLATTLPSHADKVQTLVLTLGDADSCPNPAVRYVTHVHLLSGQAAVAPTCFDEMHFIIYYLALPRWLAPLLAPRDNRWVVSKRTRTSSANTKISHGKRAAHKGLRDDCLRSQASGPGSRLPTGAMTLSNHGCNSNLTCVSKSDRTVGVHGSPVVNP